LAEDLKRVYKGASDLYIGLDASKQSFLGKLAPKLDGYDKIVFATHGYFGKDLPGIKEPVLVLTLVPHGTDGFLRMSEVAGLKMNADVVALTACQSGLGRNISGEGTMGMGRAFQYAGAKSVLMSLWSVAEKSSVQLVESFFRHIKEGRGKLVALRMARTEIRQAGYDHPFFWAPFILVGEAGEAEHAKTSPAVAATPLKPSISTGPKTQDQASVTEVSRKQAEKVGSLDDSLLKAKADLQRRAKEQLKARPEQLERFLHYEKLRIVAEQEGNQDNLFVAYTGLGQVNEALSEYTQASDSFDNAVRIAEKARLSLSQAQRAEFFEMKVDKFSRTAPYEGRSRALMKMKEFQNSLESSEYTKARTYIELLSTRRGPRNLSQPLQFDQLALKEDDWLLVYGLSDQGVIVYLMKGRKIITACFKPIAGDELRELVQTFRKPLETVELSKFDLVSGKKIADLLLRDVLDHLPKNTPVIIVPDGVLNLLPFEALVLNSGGEIKSGKGISHIVSGAEFFGDRNRVSYFQSLTALTLARTLKRSEQPVDKALVIADPVYSLNDSRSQPSGGDHKIAPKTEFVLPRLAATGELARAIAEMHKGKVDIFAGLDASKSNLLNKIAPTLRIYDTVVFATHFAAGTVIPGVTEPAFCLTMVPPGTDGLLRMSEIENLKMDCQVAVLLGAQSALGKVRGAEGLMSMARAFQLAGARCVLASLWSVAEQPSVQLVESFFRRLKQGENGLDALKLAQDEVRKAGYDHPFFWAAFILTGEVN
jgi:CHAT domain-containing protein